MIMETLHVYKNTVLSSMYDLLLLLKTLLSTTSSLDFGE